MTACEQAAHTTCFADPFIAVGLGLFAFAIIAMAQVVRARASEIELLRSELRATLQRALEAEIALERALEAE